MPLDDLNTKILTILHNNGRIRAVELAHKLNISRITAAKRLHEILDQQNITIVGVTHPTVLGFHASAHISIDIDQPLDYVVSQIITLEEIVFISQTTGEYPIVIEARETHNDALFALIDRIRSINGVKNTTTLFYTEQIVDVLRAPKISSLTIDDVDISLVKLLCIAGRMSYTALSRATGISVGTARLRVNKLIDAGILWIGIITSSNLAEKIVHIGIGIRVRGAVSLATENIVHIPGLRFLAATLGQYNLIGTFTAPDLAQAAHILDTIRAIDQIDEVHSWVHLNIVKEQYPIFA